MEYSLDISHSPSHQDNDTVFGGLQEFNKPYFGGKKREPLSIFIRDTKGNVIGGAVGYFIAEHVRLETFWIPQSLRRHGLGTKMLALFEEEGRKKGCEFCQLNTYDWQAENFYKRFGYYRIGVIENVFRERSYITLRKKL